MDTGKSGGLLSASETKALAAATQQARSDRSSSELWLAQAGGCQGERFLSVLPEDADLLAEDVAKLDLHRLDGDNSLAWLYKRALVRVLPSLLFKRGLRIRILAYNRQQDAFVEAEQAGPNSTEAMAKYLACSITQEAAEGAAAAQGILAILAEGSTSLPSLALCYLGLTDQRMGLTAFVDNDKFDHLEALIARLNPVEVILQESSSETTLKVADLLEEKQLLTSRKRLPSTDTEAALRKLEPYIDKQDFTNTAFFKSEPRAILAAGLLIDSLEDEFVYNIYTLNLANVMKISDATLEGLHIFGANSLFQVLNQTRTTGGERLLHNWLRQPMRELSDIAKRLDMMDYLTENVGLRKSLHEDCLRKVPDMERLSHKLKRKSAALADLYKVYQGASQVLNIHKLLKDERDDRSSEALLEGDEGLDQIESSLVKYVRLVEETIEVESIADGTFKVKANFDEDLLAIQKELDAVKGQIESAHSTEVRKLGLDPKVVKCERSNQHGYYFRVTLKDERALRKHKGLLIIDSAKSGIKFRSNALDRLNRSHESHLQDYLKQQDVIMAEVLDIASGFAKVILKVGRVISKLDCWVSLATASASAPTPYVRPNLNAEGIISIEAARHPCLERKQMNYIPNGVNLDKSGKLFYIITGPNLGGKSTYMRSIALCVYMAQIGCYVPCNLANICPVDAILVRLGASDSQYDGVSTFMAEMLDAARILRQATSQSLVLIDELGRGTSTFDGFSLARTIAKELATKTAAFTLFATHFFEVTQLASEVSGIGNLYCDALATVDKFTLLYNVKPGVSKKSFGINVAQLAGFPPSVVAAAESVMEEEGGVFESICHEADDDQITALRNYVEKYKECPSESVKQDARNYFADLQKNAQME